MFEVISTSLNMISLSNMPLGDWHMLRGTFYFFDYFLSYIFYRQRVYTYKIISIALIFISTCTIAIQYAFLGSETKLIRGRSILFSLLAQFFQACQILFEFRYFTDPSDPVEMLIGLEGIISMMLCICFVLPIFHFVKTPGFNSLHENIFDTISMIKNSTTLIVLVLLYILFVTFYHILSVFLIERATDRTRSILGCIRSATILVSLPLIYLIDKSSGQSFTLSTIILYLASAIEIVGFLMYDAVFRIRRLSYPPGTEIGTNDIVGYNEEDSPLILRSKASTDTNNAVQIL